MPSVVLLVEESKMQYATLYGILAKEPIIIGQGPVNIERETRKRELYRLVEDIEKAIKVLKIVAKGTAVEISHTYNAVCRVLGRGNGAINVYLMNGVDVESVDTALASLEGIKAKAEKRIAELNEEVPKEDVEFLQEIYGPEKFLELLEDVIGGEA